VLPARSVDVHDTTVTPIGKRLVEGPEFRSKKLTGARVLSVAIFDRRDGELQPSRDARVHSCVECCRFFLPSASRALGSAAR